MTLREIVHAHIPLLRAESTVRDAVEKMDIYQFPALVFVDSENKPYAVITEGDLARACVRQGSLSSLIDQPAEVYATSHPTTANADTEIADALHRMLSSGLTLLPVVEKEGYLLGVVLRVDLMQALLMDIAK